MRKERHICNKSLVDGIQFTINTVVIEVNPDYKYSLSSAIIPLENGNGLFIRQQQPDGIYNGVIVENDAPNKFSWQYTGWGLSNLKTGYASSIEACYQAFKTATITEIAA